jgi:hypothetical protein
MNVGIAVLVHDLVRDLEYVKLRIDGRQSAQL